MGAQFEDSSKVQSFNVPGRTVYSQQQVQPVVMKERVNLKFKNSPPVYRTNEAYELAPQINTQSSTKKYPVTHTVPQFYNHPVKVPVVHTIPVYKDIPYEVVLKEREDDVMDEVREIQDDIANYWNSQRRTSYYQMMSSSDEYHGHGKGYGKGYGRGYGRGYGMKGGNRHVHYQRRTLRPQAFDISDLYH